MGEGGGWEAISPDKLVGMPIRYKTILNHIAQIQSINRDL